jgi:hypothetical protein
MVEDMGQFGTGVQPPLPPSEQPRSRSKARGAAAGIGVALVVGAGGVAVATSGSPAAPTSPGASPQTTEGAPAPAPGLRGPGGGHKGFGGPIGVGAGGPVLHGTFVVAKTGGGYETRQVQTGTVDSVSSTSIAVTSKDGYKFTYVVKAATSVDAERDGITSVKKGDTVQVTATVSGKTATVDRLADTTLLAKDAPSFTGPEGGFGRGPGHGAPKSAPATPGTTT